MVEQRLNTAAEAVREQLRRRIDHTAIYRVAPSAPRLLGKAPNTYYSWQFYLRRCLYDPAFLIPAAQLLQAQLPSEPRQFAGVEDAGVALAAALATIEGTPWITVKKQRKQYGLHNWTEGTVSGAPIVLVDDLAGSKSSLKTAAANLRAFGLNTAPYYVTLINKTQGTHSENYIADRELISLFTCDDFAMTWTAYCSRYGRPPDFGAVY